MGDSSYNPDTHDAQGNPLTFGAGRANAQAERVRARAIDLARTEVATLGPEGAALAVEIAADAAVVMARSVAGIDQTEALRHLEAQRANLDAAVRAVVARTLQAIADEILAGLRAVAETTIQAAAAGAVAGLTGGLGGAARR